MHKVIVDGIVFYAPDGMLLSELLMQEKRSMEHPCGGRGRCQKCTLLVNGKEELSCQYRITSDITVSLPHQGQIQSVTGVEQTEKGTGAHAYVLDIGTTTLALALVSKTDKRIVRLKTRTNPQRSYGADVMSRIEYVKRYGVTRLQQILLTAVNEMIAQLILEYDEKYKHTLGYRRMTMYINAFNHKKYSRRRIQRIMKMLGIM